MAPYERLATLDDLACSSSASWPAARVAPKRDLAEVKQVRSAYGRAFDTDNLGEGLAQVPNQLAAEAEAVPRLEDAGGTELSGSGPLSDRWRRTAAQPPRLR